ncbi:ATP-binding protein [Metabacillus idriensis]|uniref:ATP-binding protein n=1 Tax=Metabacillus idriensis TaxID=324768 RepID=UPI002813F7F7|nr:ATP-binding protein [Metabacillus idriensis]MDR0140306.1 ATP-binding protein [Metabacillus idriensis]
MTTGKYFEIALNSSTSKIHNELKNINESSEEKKNEIRRRWIWELIQNASDCTPKHSRINITLEITDDEITFSHDGTPFTYENLLSLITQVSTKQQSEEKMTGKFGTGFMSTFLLSPIVEIKGAFIRENGTWTDMKFILDRSDQEYSDIRRKTEKMISELETLNEGTKEVEKKINKTTFTYNLNGSQESKKTVQQGAEDLYETLSYLLLFNENINSINYNRNTIERENINQLSTQHNVNIFSLKTNEIETNNLEYILFLTENEVTVACPVRYDSETELITFLPIPENMPKLFCNFPLIGSEGYAFPIIIDSDFFDVEIDRDAIRDGNADNKRIIEEAVSLYKKLITYCTDNNTTRDEFNICLLKNSKYSGLQKYCFDEIFGYIKIKSLIPINKSSDDYERRSFEDDSGDIKVRIPKAHKEENDFLFWDLYAEVVQQDKLPSKETFLGWRKVFGGNYFLKDINSKLEEMNLNQLSRFFKDEEKTIAWLDKFYSVWAKDSSMDQITKYVLVPTQDKKFNLISNVFYDSNINEELKSVLYELAPSYKEKLLDQRISAFDSYYQKDSSKQKGTEDCAKYIEKKVRNILSEETVNQADRKNEVQSTFNKLTDFILKEPDLSEVLFPKILSKRMLLSSPEETLRRMKIAEKVERNGIDMAGLDELIDNQQQIKNILLNDQLNLEQIKGLLKHLVTSTPEMRDYFEKLLARSVLNVYNYLNVLPQYSLPPTLEEWQAVKYTETIFPVHKDGKEKTIVIRPTDGDQIIFHGEGELEVLDSYDYELWTDNGHEQKIITLGDLLKTTGITKIPLRKL